MRRLGLLVVLLAVAPLAAGCGTEPGSLDGSGDAPKDTSSSRVEWKLEGMSAWANQRATGVIDYANGKGELDFAGKSDSSQLRALFIGHVLYVGAEVGGRMYWFKEPAGETIGADRFMPGPDATSPDRVLKELIASSKKVDKLGSEEIRGVATTHYRAHLDEAKLGKDSVEASGGVVDAWIDGQELPRRIQVHYSGGDGAAVVDLFDFGVPVDVEAPPADEIVSEETLTKLLRKECAGEEKAPEKMSPMCLLFGATISEGSGSDSGPVETMPRRVTDSK